MQSLLLGTCTLVQFGGSGRLLGVCCLTWICSSILRHATTQYPRAWWRGVLILTVMSQCSILQMLTRPLGAPRQKNSFSRECRLHLLVLRFLLSSQRHAIGTFSRPPERAVDTASPTTLSATGEKLRKLWQDSSYREKMIPRSRERLRELWQDSSYREKMIPGLRERALKLWQDPAYRERMMIARRERYRKLWQDPAYREKMTNLDAMERTARGARARWDKVEAEQGLSQTPSARRQRERKSNMSNAEVDELRRGSRVRRAVGRAVRKLEGSGEFALLSPTRQALARLEARLEATEVQRLADVRRAAESSKQ